MYFLITSLAVTLIRLTEELLEAVTWVLVLFSLRKTEENLEKEKYLFGFLVEGLLWRRLRSSSRASSVAELGREESQSGKRARSVVKEEWESLELLPVESRAAVEVAEEEEVLEEERRSVRTMEMRSERCRGRSWPL